MYVGHMGIVLLLILASVVQIIKVPDVKIQFVLGLLPQFPLFALEMVRAPPLIIVFAILIIMVTNVIFIHAMENCLMRQQFVAKMGTVLAKNNVIALILTQEMIVNFQYVLVMVLIILINVQVMDPVFRRIHALASLVGNQIIVKISLAKMLTFVEIMEPVLDQINAIVQINGQVLIVPIQYVMESQLMISQFAPHEENARVQIPVNVFPVDIQGLIVM